MNTIAKSIKNRIVRKQRGWVFTPWDFEDLGSREAIDKTLSRLAGGMTIRRIARGIYDYPRMSNFGPIRSDLYAVASAMARNSQSRIQVSEAYAANILGLTTQVPGKMVFYTDGTKRIRKIGNQTLIFKQASPKKLGGAGRISGLVLQGLRYFGKIGIPESAITHLQKSLSKSDKEVVLKDKASAPLWMQPFIEQIASSPANG